MANLFAQKRVAKDNSKLITEAGNQPVTITGVELVTPEKSEAVFHDGIQQLKLTGTNADAKIISLFLNSCAFAQWDDLSEAQKQSGKFSTKEYEGTTYAIVKMTGKRVVLPEDHKKSIAVAEILDGTASNCGLTDYEITDFKGTQCIFVIKEEQRGNNTRLKVAGTRPYKGEAVASEF